MKHISTITGIVIILATAAVLFGGVFRWEYLVNPKIQETSYHNQTNSNTQNSNSQTAEWKTYTSDEYGISFKYPAADMVPLVDAVNCKIKICVTLRLKETDLHGNDTFSIWGPEDLPPYLTTKNPNVTVIKTQINNHLAYKREERADGYYSFDIIIQGKNEKEYWLIASIFDFWPPNKIDQYEDKINQYQNEINNIAASFTFTK